MPSWNHRIHRAAPVLAVIAAALLAAGCASDANRSANAGNAKKNLGPKISLTGDGLNLGEAQQPALAPDKLAGIVADLLKEKRHRSAQIWVHRFPDVSLDLLRGASRWALQSDAVRFIAAEHDRQCGGATGGAWTAQLAQQAANPAPYAAFQERRVKLLGMLQTGKIADAVALALPAAAPPGALARIEALRLHGVALLVSEQFAGAAGTFDEALALARDAQPYQAAHLALLASDALRRSGDAAAAQQRWQLAVNLAAALLARPSPVESPLFWERAAYLKPSQPGWPAAVADAMTRSLLERAAGAWQSTREETTGAGDGNAADTLTWCNIGLWRLARQEAQSALVAFQRAEVLAGQSSPLRDELRLHQARALSQLGQNTPAMSLLVGLMMKPTPVGRSALAAAGVMSIEQDQTQRGLALLKRAVDSTQITPWPGRASAEADLALAYLIVGDEARGLALLHRAQDSFHNDSHELLVKSLRNEGRYMLAMKKSDESARIESRLRQVEQLNAE